MFCGYCDGEHLMMNCPQLKKRIRELAIAAYKRELRRVRRRQREIFVTRSAHGQWPWPDDDDDDDEEE